MDNNNAAALVLETVRFAEEGQRPNMTARGRVGEKRYEFVRLDFDSLVEVYDFPKSYRGIPRFVGYAPKVEGAHLVELATRATVRAMGRIYHGTEVRVDV